MMQLCLLFSCSSVLRSPLLDCPTPTDCGCTCHK
ncbi:hypothetical protein GLYMA_15G055251v4 [Glycine max]|nr:hypothetical protein GYH30_041437 [Glycine max]KRH10566.2 hypothetical protein GLYMA_15G055251v4 [Glycine max]